MVGAYAIIDLMTGGRIVEWMTPEDIEQSRRMSQSAIRGKGPWVSHTSEMWRKTVLKRAAKWAPQSEELMRALDLDDADYRDAIAAANAEPAQREIQSPKRGTAALKATLTRQREARAAEQPVPAAADESEYREEYEAEG